MCTVSVVPYDRGFRVMCNRDERLSRALAQPPLRRDFPGGYAIYPLDPDGGGTWIGANQAGLVLALLNRTLRRGAPRPAMSSRGLIIPSLVRLDGLGDAVEAAALIDVSFFQPFQLLAVQGRDAVLLTSDGRDLASRELRLHRPLMCASSSLGDERVETPRGQLFEELVVAAEDGWLRGQTRFHDHQWPRHPELSVRMSRPDARTVSRTLVDVRDGGVRVEYEALSPIAAAA